MILQDDDLDDIDFIEEEDWEDQDFEFEVHRDYPGWHLVKVRNFSEKKLEEIDEWLVENTAFGAYKRLGWYSNCAYSVGVVFESGCDAMMFKLRWT